MPFRHFRPASRKPRLLPVRMSSSDLQLQQALRHLPAIGPVRLEALRQLGVSSWTDLLQAPDSLLRQTLPANAIPTIRREAQRDLDAAARGDIAHFIDRLHVADRWRLLLRHWPQCVFLDIETAGLERDADITVIACWNGTPLRLFVNGACVKTKPTQVQPEHGTEAATINEAGELRDGKQSYSYYRCSPLHTFF